VKGELALKPTLFGSVHASVEGLELGDFTGVAKKVKVALEDGVFDVASDVTFNHAGDFHTRTDVDLTDLDASEPPNGPVQRPLGLGVPLSTAIFLLRDEDGDLKIPLTFDLRHDEGITLRKIGLKAAELVAKLVANAVKNTPLRVLSGVGDLGKDFAGLVPGG